MPYREDGSDVPERIKGKKKRRQWAHVWNSIYSQTGDEGRAFAGANAVTSKKVFAEAWDSLQSISSKALNILHDRLVKITTDPFPDTGEYNSDEEDEIRKHIELWADYAEDGPTFDPEGKYLCGDCCMRAGTDDCATVVSPINFEDGSCRIWTIGDPEHEPLPEKLIQIEVAYTERPNVKGFGCSRCQYGGSAKKADAGGRPGWCSFWGCHVWPKACCFKNTGDDDVLAPVQKTSTEGKNMSTSTAAIQEMLFRKFVPLVKVEELADGTHMTYGLVTSEVPDKDKEICDYEGAKKAYTEWSEAFLKNTSTAGQDLSMGNVRVMHGLQIGGKVVKLDFKDDKKEIWLGTQPASDEIWKLIKGGFITGLSQGGKYVKKEKEGDYIRYVPSISEVSYVDNPAHPDASFAWVKADGSIELKKFAKKGELPEDPVLRELLLKAEGDIPSRAGDIPSVAVPVIELPTIKDKEVGSGSTIKQASCGCTCAECMGGNHPGCSAAAKCNMAAQTVRTGGLIKKVKYLVTEKDGTTHLPVSDEDGKPSHRLMGAAWAALHEGFRGKKYEGPDKAGAVKRLKQLYAKEGLDTPAEKLAHLEDMLKEVIQNRAFGRMNKGMYTISRFASILEDLKYLWLCMEYERETEGDESPSTDEVKSSISDLLDHFLAYTEEQIEEEKECMLNRAIETGNLQLIS